MSSTVSTAGNTDLNRVVRAFGAEVRKQGRDTFVKCLCGHKPLRLTIKDGRVVGVCGDGTGHNGCSQERINTKIREALDTSGKHSTGDSPASDLPRDDQKKATPISPPWDNWEPISENTYRIVAAARNARKSYMPRLDVLRWLGVRETPGRPSAPHALVGFPHSLGDVAAYMAIDGETILSETAIDNLKILADAGFDGNKAKWYQAGPKRQDIVFGLLRYNSGPTRIRKTDGRAPGFYPSAEHSVPETHKGTSMPPRPTSPTEYTGSFQILHEVWLVEGVWDAACLIEHDYNAWSIGCAGQKEFAPALWAMLAQAQIVYIIRDREKDGSYSKSFAKLLDNLHSKIGARIVELPEGVKDVCELRYRTTEDSFRAILSSASNFSTAIKPRVEIVEDTDILAEVGVPDLQEAALDGWLGEKCSEELTRDGELPRAYAWIALLTVASTMVPDTVDNRIRTNIFADLVGEPHSGKNEAIERSATLLQTNIVAEGMSKPRSGEGLMKWLVEMTEHCSTLEQAPRLLLFPDELAEFMGKCNVEGSSLPWLLNTFYRYDQDAADARKEKQRLRVRLSFIAGIPSKDYDKAFKASTLGGTHDRFLHGYQPTGFIYGYQPYMRSKFDVPERTVVEIDHSVWDLTREWTKEARLKGIDLGRTVELGLRMAVIAASFSGRRKLTHKDLGPTWESIVYQQRIRALLQPNTGETKDGQLMVKLKRKIDSAPPGTWIKVNDLKKNVNAYDYGAAADRLLTSLLASGYIEEHSGYQRRHGWRIRRVLSEIEEILNA